MGKARRLIAMFKMGGVDLPLFEFQDKLLDTKHSSNYIYKIFEAADTSEYGKLVSLNHQINTGRVLDLDNPKTFNEKIQWLKVYDSTPLKTKLADKYLAREYIKETIGEEYLVPLLGVWDRFEDIDFNALPDSFALKCNHGSGWNLIVKNKKDIDWKEAKKKFDTWMNTNLAFQSGEFQYKDIPRKIIAEKYLDMSGGVKDYRFFCFNGIPKQIWVDLYSGTPAHIRSAYDMDWHKINLRCTWPDGGETLEERPVNMDLMKEFACKMSKPFPFVRIDYFEIDGKLYMGEFTFTPMNGLGVFDPPEWDLKLGNMLVLPKSV